MQWYKGCNLTSSTRCTVCTHSIHIFTTLQICASEYKSMEKKKTVVGNQKSVPPLNSATSLNVSKVIAVSVVVCCNSVARVFKVQIQTYKCEDARLKGTRVKASHNQKSTSAHKHQRWGENSFNNVGEVSGQGIQQIDPN